MMVDRRLRRSRTDSMVCGVAGGLAEYFEVDSTLVRLVFVLLTFAGGTGILIYVALCVLMPAESSAASRPADVMRENVADVRENLEEFRARAEAIGEDLRGAFAPAGPSVTAEQRRARRDATAGLLLVVVGLFVLLSNLGVFWWFRLSQLWPFLLIVLGAALLLRRGRR